MDLNRLGSGKALIEKVMKQDNLGNMGWLPHQQQNKLVGQKNPHNPNTRKK